MVCKTIDCLSKFCVAGIWDDEMKSDTKDPWGVCNDISDSENSVLSSVRTVHLEFEDSFVDGTKSLPQSVVDSDCFSRLSDSAEYLASLESKLAKLKSKRRSKDIMQSLEEKHRSCMMQMLSSDVQSIVGDEDFMLETPVNKNHSLLRYVAPDKQALTLGELVELLKADHLSQMAECSEKEESNLSVI